MENPVHDGSTSTDIVSPPVESTASIDVEVQSETKEKLNDLQGQGVKAWFMSYLFPRVTPIHWGSFLILSLFTAVPAVLYVAVFTKIGWGMDSFYYFSLNYEQYSYTLGCSLAGAAFLLYMFDCYYWSSAFGKFLRKFFLFAMVLGISLLVLFMSAQYPYGPASLFVVLTTLWLAMVRKLFFRDVEPKAFVSWLSGPMFVVATICFLVWFIWTFLEDDNEWNPELKLIEASQVGCKPDFVKYPDCVGDDGISVCYNVYEDGFIEFPDGCAETCKQVYDSCFNSFIIWMGPFLVSCGLLFLSFVATFLREDKNPENETTKFARVWMFLLFGMWVGASLSGAGAGFSSTLAAITLASFIAASIFLSFSYGKIERKEQLTSIGTMLKEKYGNHFDTFRGLLVVTCAPIFLIYFFVSFLIQRIRDVSCYVGKPSDNTESLRNIHGSGWLTVEARRLLREFESWNKTKVFTIAIYWGLAFQVLSVVVAQFTLLFLSWLIETTSEMNLGVVTGILVLVGLIMFLLPPVPGVPIYLTLGIVIIPVGRETMGVVGSICYALVVSLFLKLFACALQQEAIGGLLKHKVGVRQFVGINSNLIRSMKLVLSRPGLSLAKVSILVGGPDWPTSVLCGIMGLDLIPILVGTLPIIFLIIPTLLTGSFTYMGSARDANGDLEFPWASTLAALSAALTAFVQFGSMVIAAYYLEQVVSNEADELENIPIDEEVKEADEQDEKVNDAYTEITEWSSLPLWSKILLLFSLITMIASCYLVQFFMSQCFTEYQLTYTIDEHLGGDWKNLVKPLGVVSNVLLLASCLFLYIFRSWAMSVVKQNLAIEINTVVENQTTETRYERFSEGAEEGAKVRS